MSAVGAKCPTTLLVKDSPATDLPASSEPPGGSMKRLASMVMLLWTLRSGSDSALVGSNQMAAQPPAGLSKTLLRMVAFVTPLDSYQ